MGGLVIFCVAILLLSLVPAYWMLFPVMLLAGLGNCVFHPADYSILSASIDSKRLGVAYGSHTFAGNLGWALAPALMRSEEHTSELQSLMRISYAVFCLKKKKHTK